MYQTIDILACKSGVENKCFTIKNQEIVGRNQS